MPASQPLPPATAGITMYARAVNIVSATEMDRRLREVRARMREHGVDALVLQSSSDWVGGYVRWFTNQPASNGYPSTVICPIEGGLALIEQGPFDGEQVASDDEARLTGVVRRLTTPSYPSVDYTGSYDAQIAAKELQTLGARRVGFVAPGAMYHSFGRHLHETLTQARVAVTNFTDEVDRLKAIKSDEERALIRQVAAMQDEVMSRVAGFVKPGLRDFEIAAYAQYVGQQLGSEQGIFLCSSAPPGHAAAFRPRYMQGRRLEHGDVYSLLIENNGAGGFYAELSRILVLGRAPMELRDVHAKVLDAQQYALSLLTPGAACAEVHAEHNEYLRNQQLPVERRLNMHGMGYDMVERPLVRHDETMHIRENMALVCHPGVMTERLFVHNTDLYLIEERGVSRCLHSTPKGILEIDC